MGVRSKHTRQSRLFVNLFDVDTLNSVLKRNSILGIRHIIIKFVRVNAVSNQTLVHLFDSFYFC